MEGRGKESRVHVRQEGPVSTNGVMQVVLSQVGIARAAASAGPDAGAAASVAPQASAGAAAGLDALSSLSYWERSWSHVADAAATGVLAGVLLLLALGIGKVTRDAFIQKRLRSIRVSVFAYAAAEGIAALVRPGSEGLGRGLHVLALAFITLACVQTAGVLIIDVLVSRMRRFHFPVIIRDLIVIIVFLVAAISVLGSQGLDLTAVAASAGFLGIVFGLAMQDSLGNVFAGLSLQMERPFDVDDWVRFDEKEGKVREINWRSVKIETLNREVVIIPNTVITKASIVNLSKPTHLLRRETQIGFRYEDPPNRIKSVVMDALLRIPGVVKDPPPAVLTIGYKDYNIIYRILYYIQDLDRRELIEDEVNAKIWYALERAGISVPFPIQDLNVTRVEHLAGEEKRRQEEAESRHRQALLSGVPLFSALPPEDVAFLAGSASLQRYSAGEAVVRQGEAGDSFFVVRSGQAEVRVTDPRTAETAPVARLSTGDYFGEMSLITGEPRSATVVALDDSLFLVVDKTQFKRVVESDQSALERISAVVVSRKLQMEQGLDKMRRESSQEIQAARDSLVQRILAFLKS